MAKVTEAADLAAERISRAGKDFAEGMKNVFKKGGGMSDEAFAAATKPGKLQRLVTAPLQAGWYVVSRPIAWGTQLVGYSAEKLGAGFKARPGVGLAVVGAGAVLGIGHLLNKREERNATMDLAQLQAAQQQAAMGQAQANTVTQADMDLMNQRLAERAAVSKISPDNVRASQQAVVGPAV